jgi:hypothetical protein
MRFFTVNTVVGEYSVYVDRSVEVPVLYCSCLMSGRGVLKVDASATSFGAPYSILAAPFCVRLNSQAFPRFVFRL